MSYVVRDLDREIATKVEWMDANNGPTISKDWLVQAILSDHQDVSGNDADFAIFGAKETTRARVERFFRTIKSSEEDPTEDEQLRMPGFEYLQKRYLVPRYGESVIVPVGAMTEEELISKASEHRRMGAGHFAHADEMDRFRRDRSVAA